VRGLGAAPGRGMYRNRRWRDGANLPLFPKELMEVEVAPGMRCSFCRARLEGARGYLIGCSSPGAAACGPSSPAAFVPLVRRGLEAGAARRSLVRTADASCHKTKPRRRAQRNALPPAVPGGSALTRLGTALSAWSVSGAEKILVERWNASSHYPGRCRPRLDAILSLFRGEGRRRRRPPPGHRQAHRGFFAAAARGRGICHPCRGALRV